MSRVLPVLVLALAACGAPICAGCGADDGGDALPATFAAQFRSLVSSTDATCGQWIDDRLTIADGTMTSLRFTSAAYTVVDGGWEASISTTGGSGGSGILFRMEPGTGGDASVELTIDRAAGPCAHADYGPVP